MAFEDDDNDVSQESTSNEDTGDQPNFLFMTDEEVNNWVEPVAEVKEESQEEEANEEQEGEDDGEVQERQEETNEVNQSEVSTDAPDYKALYEAVLAPFKANGKEVQVQTVEDVKTLMQMGANYNKKMQALKPNLKILKMLENNGLLDEVKLNFLIDLDKKNPEAIAKYIKEGGIDPLDIDVNKSEEYTPNTYNVSDGEVALHEVFDEIRDTPGYVTTLDLINNKLDSASRKVLFNDPNSIKIINDHVQTGVYDQVMNIVESERMLGRLQGMSDLDAYKHVGLLLQQQGAFNASPKGSTAKKNPDVTTGKATTDKQREQERLDKKRAAGSPTGTSSKSKLPEGFNPLALSDAEFEKYASGGLFK